MDKPRFILHHYEDSPYAEKIRLMFGLTNMAWGSVLSPVQPPRPNVDPLTGGYRRIPVAQLGADIFCDSQIIAAEIAAFTEDTRVAAIVEDAAADALVNRGEGDVFFCAITRVSPLKLMGTLLMRFGPLGMFKFVKDRQGMMKGGTVKPPQGAAAQKLIDEFMVDVDAHLSSRDWMAGETASYADFAVFHPLWLASRAGGLVIADSLPQLKDWFSRVAAIGSGARQELDAVVAFAAARENEPRALPQGSEDTALINTAVSVAPMDYGRVPVTGVLVAYTPTRIIVARQTDEFGCVNVHFPRVGYSVVAE